MHVASKYRLGPERLKYSVWKDMASEQIRFLQIGLLYFLVTLLPDIKFTLRPLKTDDED